MPFPLYLIFGLQILLVALRHLTDGVDTHDI